MRHPRLLILSAFLAAPFAVGAQADSVPPKPTAPVGQPQDTTRRDSIKTDSARRDSVRAGSAQRDSARRDSARTDSTQSRDSTVRTRADSGARADSNPRADSGARPDSNARADSVARAKAASSPRAKVTAKSEKKPSKPRALTAEEFARARRDSVLNSWWPVSSPEPLPGAILPHKRIVAYYGNPFSKRMGVLGEYPSDSMLKMLDAEVAAWEKADPSTPVQPALHLIAVVAQASPGSDSMYRARMPDSLVIRVASWAATRGALVFLDVQVGLSTLQAELPRLEKFMRLPNFHLGIDPEFSMKNGGLPGKSIGTFDAADINYATKFLADMVYKYGIPPKILVIHRFTQGGVTNYQNIKLDPAVQIVMHMDGFGKPWLKRNTFREYIKAEPVQFAGWKQFYKLRNDNPRTTIESILELHPKVLYIQYQ